MSTIKVKFEWTKLFKLSDTEFAFRKVSTETEALTFDEIEQIHLKNYSGNDSVCRDYGYLTENNGQYSLKMDLNTLREKAENSNTVYIVELDYPWLRFSPVKRTKREHTPPANDLKVLESPRKKRFVKNRQQIKKEWI